MTDGKLVVELAGYARQEVVEAVARIAMQHLHEQADSDMRNQVALAVDNAVREITETAILAEVRKVLEEGWTPTNQYGEPRGARVTLRQRLSEQLTAKCRYRGYNEPEEPYVEHLARKVVEETLRTEFKKELEAARATFKKTLDAELGARLSETLKSALGLR